MTQLSRQARKMFRQEVKNSILWFVGCYTHAHVRGKEGLIKVKEKNFFPTFEEIKSVFNPTFFAFLNKDQVDSKKKFEVRRSTLYRFIKQLKDEKYIEQPERGVYRLTDLGKKRWSLLDALYRTNKLPAVKPIGTFFSTCY